ncbi:hypothetical protein Mal64_16640 [Pseudobythopirellula maris]|uniref:DUF6677 domain-containing protein n=1 Tax=Pseudobythopirellula maris TaxID=2527991 RepID=A0A5C5ZLY6_9BACT|nr:DUF6677 family protein [Pseudobythopirellula maris]TWT88185.1 hypothetical protein Mal64_16640 [Pseudobythopirellula maris]
MTNSPQPGDGRPYADLELKNRYLAGFLAWLVPGLGHLYQGRTGKGLLYAICILGTFVFGFYVGDGKVAYATPLTVDVGGIKGRVTQLVDRWQFICQSGIGAVAIPGLVERDRMLKNEPPLMGGWFRPPRTAGPGVEISSVDAVGNQVLHPGELAKWTYDLGYYFDLGTVYTVIAGMLNVIVIYDACCGPMVVHHEPKKSKKPGGKKAEGEDPGGAAN